MSQNSSSPWLARLRSFATQHPLVLFLTVAFGFVFPLMALPILAQHGIIPGASLPARFGLNMERAASALIILPGLVLATVVVTALEGGRAALLQLFRRVVRWRIGLAWALIIVAALPATTVALAVLMGDTLRTPSIGVLVGEVGEVLVAFLLVNLLEETAWSGFFQSRLERRHSFFVAAALTAVPFAAIHMPLQVINGNTSLSVLAQTLVLYIIFQGLAGRPLVGMVLRGSGDSVLAAALMHTFFNRSNNADGIAADLLSGPNRPLAALLATLLLAVVLGLVMRYKLTRAYRQELDALNDPQVDETHAALRRRAA